MISQNKNMVVHVVLISCVLSCLLCPFCFVRPPCEYSCLSLSAHMPSSPRMAAALAEYICLYECIYIYIEREREKEGPRLRVMTVRKCAALTSSRLPNQAPAALHPSHQVGGDLSPSPPGDGHEKIRDEAHPWGNVFILTEGACHRAGAGLPGGGWSPAPLGLPAARVPIEASAPGCLRAPLADALTTWGGGRDPARTRPEATWGGRSSCRGPLGGATSPAAAPLRNRPRADIYLGNDPGARPASRGCHPGLSIRRWPHAPTNVVCGPWDPPRAPAGLWACGLVGRPARLGFAWPWALPASLLRPHHPQPPSSFWTPHCRASIQEGRGNPGAPRHAYTRGQSPFPVAPARRPGSCSSYPFRARRGRLPGLGKPVRRPGVHATASSGSGAKSCSCAREAAGPGGLGTLGSRTSWSLGS